MFSQYGTHLVTNLHPLGVSNALISFLDLGGTPFSPDSPFPIRGDE
jgi:hypothetical protein